MLEKRFRPIVQKRLGLALALWGEAGIGKSHQVRELLRTLPCQSLSLHATTSFSGVAQTLPRPKKLALWAEHNMTRLAKGEAVESSSVLDSFGAVLAGLAPFVLHLEDIHEADQERLEFLQALAKLVLRIKGVALVVTSRREPPEPFTSVKLEPLSKQEADTLLEQELKATLPKEALEWLYSRAAGNPLYTLEYLRYLTRQGFLWNDGKSWHWRKPEQNIMPVTVEALIEQLLNQAKSEPLKRYVLETRAFLPRDSSNEVWQQVARVGATDLQTAVRELSRLGIFKDNDFAHPLFREVTLKTLATERKQHLARRAINILGDKPEQAAMFVDEAGLEASQSLELLKKASEHVKERNAVEAARFLAKAVTYATGEEKNTLTVEAVTALQHYDIPRATALVERFLNEEPNNIEALYLGTNLYVQDADETKAKQLFSRLPRSERESQRGIETLLEMYRALDKHEDYLTVWEQNKTRLPDIGTKYLYFIVFTLSSRAKHQEAIALANSSLERSKLTLWERTRLLNSLGIAYDYCGQNEQAIDVYTQLIDDYASHIDARRLTGIFHNRSHAKLALGRYVEARDDILQSYKLANETGNGYFAGAALITMGDIAIELAEYEQAEMYLTNSLELLKKRHLTPFVVDAETTMCNLYLSWQLPHSRILALKHAYGALDCARKVEDVYSLVSGLFVTTFAEASYGSTTKALELARELETLAQHDDTPSITYHAAWAKAKALTTLNNAEEARDYFQKAYETAQQAKHELVANKIGLELDRLNNDVESARKRMHWFEERGLLNGVNIAKRYFPELADLKEVAMPAKSSVRLEVLGPLQVTGQSTSPVRGRKRQELLALLLEARISGRSEVSRLTLLDALYSGEDELKASSSLKSVVHHLRGTYGESFITTTSTGYALGACSSDAETFLQTGNTSLWHGIYLEGLELSDESTVQGSLYELLYDKAKSLLEHNPKEAARVGRILIEAEPYTIGYLKTYLTALRLSNSHSKLTRHYQTARQRLLEVGETLPDTWQHFLS